MSVSRSSKVILSEPRVVTPGQGQRQHLAVVTRERQVAALMATIAQDFVRSTGRWGEDAYSKSIVKKAASLDANKVTKLVGSAKRKLKLKKNEWSAEILTVVGERMFGPKHGTEFVAYLKGRYHHPDSYRAVPPTLTGGLVDLRDQVEKLTTNKLPDGILGTLNALLATLETSHKSLGRLRTLARCYWFRAKVGARSFAKSTGAFLRHPVNFVRCALLRRKAMKLYAELPEDVRRTFPLPLVLRDSNYITNAIKTVKTTF